MTHRQFLKHILGPGPMPTKKQREEIEEYLPRWKVSIDDGFGYTHTYTFHGIKEGDISVAIIAEAIKKQLKAKRKTYKGKDGSL